MAITLHGLPDNHEAMVNAAMRLRRPYIAVAVTGGSLGLLDALLMPWGPTNGARVRWFGLVLVAAFLALSPLLLRYLLQRQMRAIPDEPWIMLIDEERISCMTPSGGTDYRWGAIGSVIETPEAFILRNGRVILTVLPKDQFQGDDVRRLRKLVADLGKA
jgi:hypothetical protein